MSREPESHVSSTPVSIRRTWAFATLPAFISTRRGKATVGLVAAALLGVGTLSTASYLGADIPGQVAQKAQSFMSLMKQRSPGARTGDMLTKTKGRKYAVLAASVPAPQSAPSEAAAPPMEFAPSTTPVAELANLGPVYATPLGAGDFPPISETGGPPGGWPPYACCGGGGGPPGPPGGPSGPPGPPGETPGVPEPATWAMMLIGFGSIGWSLRRQRARAVQAIACA